MTVRRSVPWISAGALAILAGTAVADTPRRIGVYAPAGAVEPSPAALISNKIFVNRCENGCTFTQSSSTASSSRLNQTWLGGDFDTGQPGSGPPGQVYTFPPCPATPCTDERRCGDMTCDDALWDQIVACVQDTYAPYDVIVTDVDPGTAVPHHEAVAAGQSSDLGLSPFVGGVGPISGGCALHEDTVSFSFDIWPTIFDMCSTIAQETGHGFGIEHSFNCQDAMGSGYVNPSCGPAYFRNETLPCADESLATVPGGGPRDCICSGSQQNVHSRLLNTFGLNPTPLPSPAVDLSIPTNGATFPSGDEFDISAQGTLRRGMGKAELWLNGYKWVTQEAMRNQTIFNFTYPPDAPDGVVDVEVRIFNDLETVYGTQTVTVTRGAPCADESSCLAGQHCDAGKCAWDPPSGALGDACEYPQFCLTGQCENGLCTSSCQVGIDGFCPAEYECVSLDGGVNGFCFSEDAEDPGGCCSAGSGTPTAALIGQLGLVGLVLGGVMRRRRRRS